MKSFKEEKKEGSLLVHLLRGDFARDTDFLKKMDPYCIFQLNDQRSRSSVKDNAGKTPSWNESFSFRCKEGDVLHFDVFDKDPKIDDHVCSGELNVHSSFIDNQEAFSYPMTYKDKPCGTICLQMTFLPDDPEVLNLVINLQNELNEKKNIIKDIQTDIDENLKNPPKPKPESLLMKNLLDIFETKKNNDKIFIENSITEVEKPYIDKLKQLNNELDQLTHESNTVNLQNAEGLSLLNKASYELGLYKSLIEKGFVKVKVIDLKIFKDKKYDAYLNFYIDKQNYKTSVMKGMKISASFKDSFEVKRSNDDFMAISLLNKTSVGSDDILGTGAVDMIPVILGKELMQMSVELKMKDKDVGIIELEMQFIKE